MIIFYIFVNKKNNSERQVLRISVQVSFLDRHFRLLLLILIAIVNHKTILNYAIYLL